MDIDWYEFEEACVADRYEDEWWPIAPKGVLGETAKAWRVKLAYAPHALWLPKSKCQVRPDNSAVFIPGWLARAKNLQDRKSVV